MRKLILGLILAGVMTLVLVFTPGLPGDTAMAAAPTDVNAAGCGATFNTPGERLRLTDDLTCPGTAVIIAADDVHFNLQGFTITGADGGLGIDVGSCVTTSGVHINHGTVTGFIIGINLCNATNAHVNGMTVTGNHDGIALSGSDNNQINGSFVNGNTIVGVVLYNSHGNTLHTMEINENGESLDGVNVVAIYGCGVELIASNDNVITSSEIIGNAQCGVIIDGTSERNTINGNIVNENDLFLSNLTGIEVFGSNNTIRSNTVNGNSTGIAVLGSNNLIRGNTTNNNFLDGIAVLTVLGATGNRIQSNTASGNGIIFGFDLADYFDASCAANTWKSNNGVNLFQGCENG